MMSKKIIYAFACLILFSACGQQQVESQVSIRSVLSDIQKTYAPDSRTAIFQIEMKGPENKPVLAGVTDQPAAKQELLHRLKADHITFVDHIRLLPDASLGDSTHAVVNNSVANLRAKPHFSAELTTQATLGMPLKLLEKKGGWFRAQTPDHYISWIQRRQIRVMDNAGYAEWRKSPKLIFTRMYGASYRKAGSSQQVSDLEAGNILKLTGRTGSFYRVEYPDGRQAFVAQSDAEPFDRWVASLKTDRASLVKTSRRFIGIPYLWGGTSAKGVDCSGLMKMVFLLNGMVLPRDASQQARAGEVVDSVRDFSNLLPGDLLFFGRKATDSTAEKVVHVGMWIGNDEYIQSLGRVHISSMNPKSPRFDAYNLGRYLKAERILNSRTNDIVPLKKVIVE